MCERVFFPHFDVNAVLDHPPYRWPLHSRSWKLNYDNYTATAKRVTNKKKKKVQIYHRLTGFLLFFFVVEEFHI